LPRCLISFFSQGGTTTRIAESIADGLRRSGYEVDLAKIGRDRPPDVSGYDLIAIGSPVYYFRLPFPVTDYLERLPRLDGLPAFAFLLHGTIRGDAGERIRRALAGKGARDAGTFTARGADRFLGYLKLGVLFSPEHPTYEEIMRAEQFGRDVARRAAEGSFQGIDEERPPAFVYRVERFLTGRRLTRHLYSRLFRVSRKKCTACDICMKLCPVGNLMPGEGGRPVWGQDCILCLTCEQSCPKDAINSPVTGWLFRPFLLYNVRRASRDPDLTHVRVAHRRGRTEIAKEDD